MDMSLVSQNKISSREMARITGKRISCTNKRIENKFCSNTIEEIERNISENKNGTKTKEYFLTLEQAIAYLSNQDINLGLKFAEKHISGFSELKNITEAILNFEVPDDLDDMYVYYIKNKRTSAIKIGISRNPEQRLKQLQTGNDGELELIATKHAENRFRDEKAEHIKYESKNILGEWFDDTDGEISKFAESQRQAVDI